MLTFDDANYLRVAIGGKRAIRLAILYAEAQGKISVIEAMTAASPRVTLDAESLQAYGRVVSLRDDYERQLRKEFLLS